MGRAWVSLTVHRPLSTVHFPQMPSHQRIPQNPTVDTAVKPPDPFHRWLLAGMTALLVARPLFPSESAAQGDGLPVVMLWLALAVLWLVGAIGRRRFILRFGPVDAAVLALLGWQCIAAVHAVRCGSPRPALNMFWESVGLGIMFFLARQLMDDARAAAAVMIALMAAISVYGIYQSAVELPATQREYKADPEAMLRKAGLNCPPGSALRDAFERRLANREPLATFALTNSLAAALAPWLVVGLGIVAAARHDRRRWIAWTICLAPIATCLLLTKSRSGYVAAAVGIIWLVFRHWPAVYSFGVRRLAAAFQYGRPHARRCEKLDPATPGARALALQEADGTRSGPAALTSWLVKAALLAGLLAATVTIVVLVKPKAATSFGYRVQYWQATLRMIADRPWLGCGPGNFQDVYTQYKLPEASEEVADPHDFLFEVWATAGTPALLALLGVLGLFWVCRAGQDPRHPCSGSASAGSPKADAWKPVLAGLIGGFLLSIPLGRISCAPPSSMAIVIGLPVAVVCMALLIPWVRSGTFPPTLAGVGVAVLLVDLLTTGGIGIPSVAQSLWLLLALGLDGAWPRNLPRSVAIVLLAIGLGLSVACHQTSYARVLPCQSFQQLARREYFDGRRQAALELLHRAVDADPRSSDAHALMAEIYLDSWLASLDSADYRAFETHDALARRLAPEAAPIWRASADRYRRAFVKADARGRHVQPRAIEQAIAIARRTAELYPGSSSDHAALAMDYRLSGDEISCRREAETALDLDRRMTHEEKKLPEALRRRLEAVVEGTEPSIIAPPG